MEQEEYTKEQIDWSYIEFVDNQDVLDLLEKVFSLWFTFFFFLNPNSRKNILMGHVCANFECYSNYFWVVFGSFYTPSLLLFTTLFFLLLQKPGGIIALLDEAWYVTLIYAFQDNLHLYE